MNVRSAVVLVSAYLVLCGCHGNGQSASAPPGTAPIATAGDTGNQNGKILYYRNPMGLPDTSPVPKKDAMGMDYIPVYAGEEMAPGRIHLPAEKISALGVRTEPASRRSMARTLRIAGTLEVDERRRWTVSPRFDGWITALPVSTVGAIVHRGDVLLEVYSPELVGAQEDYRIAAAELAALAAADRDARAGAEALVRSSGERLTNLGIAAGDLPALRSGATARRELPLRAEHDGVVIEKSARVGMRFGAGEALYQLADLSTLWLIGSVAEQDVAQVRIGAPATASMVAYPGRTFGGRVTFVSAVLQPETRTAQVRIEVPNRDGRLKPAMFGTVDVPAASDGPRLAVPESAVLDTGMRQLVIIDRGDSTFEPRDVRVGTRGNGYAELLDGVREGELVVVNGNFLIDAESNLRAAIGGSVRQGSSPTAGARPTAPVARPEH